jgi:hypothetical protein
MRGHPGDVRSAGAVFEEYQRVHPAQVDQVDVYEVAGDDALGSRGQELAPRRAAAARGRIDAGRGKDLPNCRGTDGMAEANKFALDRGWRAGVHRVLLMDSNMRAVPCSPNPAATWRWTMA